MDELVPLVVPARGLFLGAIASLIMDAELHTLPGRGALMSKDHTAATVPPSRGRSVAVKLKAVPSPAPRSGLGAF